MNDDGIEVRVRAWFNMPPSPPLTIIRVLGRESWLLSDTGLTARVDGGDPGDEAPWEEREDFYEGEDDEDDES